MYRLMDGSQVLLVIAGFCFGATLAYAFFRVRSAQQNAPQPSLQVTSCTPVVKEAIDISRPYTHTVEGLEIKYQAQGLVRSVRVGAMNSEHKELLMTMDAVAWRALPNAQKQEVLAAARSTWASKMCPEGPDIAYVILKTENGEVIGRADPHSVRIL